MYIPAFRESLLFVQNSNPIPRDNSAIYIIFFIFYFYNAPILIRLCQKPKNVIKMTTYISFGTILFTC